MTSCPRPRAQPVLIGLAATCLAISCGSDRGTGPVPPDPGPLRVVLTAAPAHAAGLLLEVSGDVDGPFIALDDHRLWERSASPSKRTLLVVGPLQVGPLLEFRARDRNAAYGVRVLDAAGGVAVGYASRSAADFAFEVRE